MTPLLITIHVNAAAAARAGRGQQGAAQLTLGDAELRSLTPVQRETLAKHYERVSPPWGDRGPQWSDPLAWHTADLVDRASLDVLRTLLDRRAFVMAQYEETWTAPDSGLAEQVLLALAEHLPQRDVAGFSWPVVRSALLFAAERCDPGDR